MGFDEGRIILDSDNGAYYPGQSIYGRLEFDQQKDKNIHGIYVSFKGFCKVHWTSQRSRRVNDRTEHYTVNHDSYEEYIHKKHFVFGNESGERHLNPGHHEYRFDFHIPVNSPSTFEGSYGHIRYRVKAVMLTTGMFSSNKTKMAVVRVVTPTDLNLNPYCKEPIEYEILQSYCCWCVNAGSSEVLVKLPVAGYCPGQIIPIEVNCKNNSSVEIEEIKFAIKKDETYTATSESGSKNVHDTVAEIKKGPVPGHTTRNWTVEMEVPAMEVFNVDSCRFIDITYNFKVSTEVSGCHEGEEETRQIIFGTIPLVGYQDNVQNPLHDQMPRQVQGITSSYPPPPIINQPLPMSPYPNPTTYPMNGTYPTSNPNVVPHYPNPANQPYPNSPYPNPNPVPPYPNNPSPVPYPTGNNSSRTSPYPNNPSPVPPYPGVQNVPQPYPSPNVPQASLVKTGTFGFTVQSGDNVTAPLLPQGANVPYPITPSTPYARASAPEPATPGSEDKKPFSGTASPADVIPNDPPYNPEFMKIENEKSHKKEEDNK